MDNILNNVMLVYFSRIYYAQNREASSMYFVNVWMFRLVVKSFHIVLYLISCDINFICYSEKRNKLYYHY